MAASILFSSASFSKSAPDTLVSIRTRGLYASILSLSPSSLKPFSLTCRKRIPSISFVRNVTLSAEYNQDQEEEEDGYPAGAASFSPDLKLFVGNLPYNVDSSRLAGLFEQAGNVEMVEVIYDKLTGRSRGFGFVTMSTVQEAELAEKQFNGYELDGRTLRVNAGPPPQKLDSSSRGSRGAGGFNDSSNRVHVGNLSWGVDDLALETLFSEHGRVMEARVVYDRESGRSRGFGFVTLSSADEVNGAIDSLNGAVSI
ncbi:unnamed protein product [Victoria cruziana]